MNHNAKKLYEKMIDYKRFAVVLLAVGAFFYLGVVIPSATKVMADLYIRMAASTGFLANSVMFFILSSRCQSRLMEMEEGQEYLIKK
ncbi:hypothetical protein C0971_12875 [Bacillus methanolicus]|uniref:YrhC family protein n=1 Tax=Bacillus methanolicus TaxID=1471 RepID=UPI00200CBA06|nr:YrhC family protein [Bacillus methanolicus]UQD52829.1 hypothetical protein C0971_12875 [Bacillus methanolicus]